MPNIHLIDGEKGGIGKSMFCRVLAEYCQTEKIDFALIDTDRTNPDVGRVYVKGVSEEQTFFSEKEENDAKVDVIFETALSKMVLVNLPAQIFPVVTDWIERNELLTLGQECGVQIYKWFVCTGEGDSIELFLDSLKHFEKRLPHILVRNLGASGAKWETAPAEYERLEQIISKYRIPTIDLPKLPPLERDYIKKNQCSFAEASKKLKLMSKQRISIFLNKAYDAIESTQLICASAPFGAAQGKQLSMNADKEVKSA
ncbi:MULTISPECIES: mobilization protein [unclassified Coleofasciculus]|uniref:mobilization protein n=1 Tax=unclassified Coleofasciculus TaxID=2692782 RepID=UPI00187F242C|nr:MULTISPECIES: mobilization protein [unclassified Coleofasciculus]MBE9128029.1 mobilization protein [Coleofasciculus sp. LEGE 07081]MBE9150531.1 mobilization protein [Coleofasciculus sp. LEGE 07092]